MKMKAKEKIPDGYATRIVGPFLVIGDESPARVDHHARTVEWTVEHLKKDFNMREPPHVIDVWLLGSRDSYVDNAMRLFGMPPRSPYGYFVAQQQALIMNIGTGGGTLVHELVHPFIAASFPSAPAWFNEGLASLYEAVREKDGQFWGLPNWRLVGLKRAIRAGKLPSFETMTGDSDAALLHVQHGIRAGPLPLLLPAGEGPPPPLLRPVLARASQADPTGYKTLVKVLGEPNMARFEKQWQAWALALEAD